MIYSGKNNSILLTREYYLDYGCSNFDLVYYPFDTQMCTMVFEVQGKTDEYIVLKQDYDGVKYLGRLTVGNLKLSVEFLFVGGRFLVEYEIQMEKLEVASVGNVSTGTVKIVFRRRMEFHVTNTFLQNFVLIGVGYMSLFFDVDNFTDRIMVTLTTMLVVATITASIQAVRNFINELYFPVLIKSLLLLGSTKNFLLQNG